jgi:hypothetical protein
MSPTLLELLAEYARALAYTDSLRSDLTPDEVRWRPNELSSPIGWHLGHQATIAHFIMRNMGGVTEPSPAPDIEPMMDSTSPVLLRGQLPDLDRLIRLRTTVADRVQTRIATIAGGTGPGAAPMRSIGAALLISMINHEYHHDQWIAQVRSKGLGHELPDPPASEFLSAQDHFLVIDT